MELSCQGEFARHWLLAANLTRQNGEDADGNDLVHRAKTIASINATYRSVSDMRITLGIYYNGSQTDSYFDSLFNRLPVRVVLTQ
ncbi:MAG: hypothetical protein GXP18_10975 [Gammaproteobacteria bacterium]|nr:hypothetical protein [Gammaproteobacteria bacterium]